MEFPQEWIELFESLSSNRVRYLIVGGHALGAHASPRRTDDIDIFVEPTLENARRVGNALGAFGYPALGARWRTFAERDRMATLGVPPLRVDIMTSITGVDFAEAWAGRVVLPQGKLRLPFLGRDELLKNKRASARLKDLADVAALTGESREELLGAALALTETAKRKTAKKKAAKKKAAKKKAAKKKTATKPGRRRRG
ncbi:MAG: hypothetical protein AB7S26_13595 [Sandaracinaceae bacterium]